MTDREIEIIDAVGEYVDNKFEGKGRLDGSYIEEAQDYYNELLDKVEDAYEDKTDCDHCYYDSTCIDGENGDLVMMGHYCSDSKSPDLGSSHILLNREEEDHMANDLSEYIEPYTLASIDDVAKEMYQDETATRTLKKALGL